MDVKTEAERGKVYVKGSATEKYTCDLVTLEITFGASGTSASKASESATIQCEQFLTQLEAAGVDITTLQLQEDRLSQPAYRDSDKTKASRRIAFTCLANASVNNQILGMIQKGHYDVEVSTDYSLSNENELRKELMKKAINDSREKAELLAAAAGKQVVGIYTIDMENSTTRARVRARTTIPGDDIDCIFEISRKLSMPEKTLTETVEAVWLID